MGPWLLNHPRRLQALLDSAFLASALAIFGQVWDPDVLFHVIWVVLTLQAFLFGLRVSIARIVIRRGVRVATTMPTGHGSFPDPGGASQS